MRDSTVIKMALYHYQISLRVSVPSWEIQATHHMLPKPVEGPRLLSIDDINIKSECCYLGFWGFGSNT
jgi:hypothetical protein